MKVILLQDLRGLGKKNDVREVSEGYGRNFLMPRGLAKIADQAAIAELNSKAEDARKKTEADKAKLRDISNLSQNSPLVFKLKVGERNEVFGSVGVKEVKEMLVKTYPALDSKEFEIRNERPIKALGAHDISVNLGEAEGKIRVVVEKA